MKLSKRSEMVEHSMTRKIFNSANKYDDVIDLTLGDPDFDTPNYIKEAGINAILCNKTHYSMNAGVLDARKAISKKIKKVWNVDSDPENEIIITVGGMEALYLSILSLVDPESEVIIFAPYYVNYTQMIQMCGGTPIVINAYDNVNGMNINAEILEEKVSEKTVAIIINSPNNPTGSILSYESLKIIAEVAEKYDLAIISDEVYRTLVFDDNKHQSILQFESVRKRTVLIDSLSKEFSMTGWRIGYAFAPPEIIDSMIRFQENVVACASVPSQCALIEAYTKDTDIMYIKKEFQKRRDIICEALSEIQGISFIKPQGSFYIFVNISSLNMRSEEFAYELLREKHIAVVPGKAYGEQYDGYIRIAFTKSINDLLIAAKRIKEFVNNLIN